MSTTKKKKICVVTGTRAEYGLLSGLLQEIKRDNDLKLQLIVTGTHLERRFGYTYAQIVKDGFTADAKISMKLTSDTDAGIVRGVGREFIGLSTAFERLMPDIVVILGDRFETLAVAIAATLFRIPVAHIHGGEVTEGAYDDGMRHAITKLASLHFVAHQDYAGRVMQMGEDQKRVFNYGAPGLDVMRRLKLLSKSAVEEILHLSLGEDVVLVTFHPVTQMKGFAEKQIWNMIKALDKSGLRMIFTMPNSDAENHSVFNAIRVYVRTHPERATAVTSLGQLRYFSLMQYVGLMVGNSSSGIIEAPSFKLPVVNIGTRQDGRVKARNVIDCKNDVQSIQSAIVLARSPKFRKELEAVRNPFDGGDTSLRIVREIKRFVTRPVRVKKFIDLIYKS